MPGASRARATLKDVARASGVSPATVSFVLNETPGQTISPETQDKVRAAARQLGYTPHRIARALREGATRTVLLNVAGLPSGHSLESFVIGLDDELRSLDHTLLVTHRRDGAALPAEIVDAVAPRAVLDLGALYYGGDDTGWEGGWATGLAAHGLAQIRHLAAQGHREIALAFPGVGVDARFVQIRLEHAREAAASSGLPPPAEVWLADRAEAPRELAALRRHHPGVTAIAAFSDDIALVVLGSLADLGFRVPEDMAVIGFDEGLHGALWRPTLTTVRIDAEAHGRRAARAVLGREPHTEHPAPSVIVRRESA